MSEKIYDVSADWAKRAFIDDAKYREMYARSVSDPNGFWAEQAKFKEHSEKLVGETGKLLAAAKTNSLDNLKVAFGSAANTCKGCHDNFRRD